MDAQTDMKPSLGDIYNVVRFSHVVAELYFSTARNQKSCKSGMIHNSMDAVNGQFEV